MEQQVRASFIHLSKARTTQFSILHGTAHLEYLDFQIRTPFLTSGDSLAVLMQSSTINHIRQPPQWNHIIRELLSCVFVEPRWWCYIAWPQTFQNIYTMYITICILETQIVCGKRSLITWICLIFLYEHTGSYPNACTVCICPNTSSNYTICFLPPGASGYLFSRPWQCACCQQCACCVLRGTFCHWLHRAALYCEIGDKILVEIDHSSSLQIQV